MSQCGFECCASFVLSEARDIFAWLHQREATNHRVEYCGAESPCVDLLHDFGASPVGVSFQEFGSSSSETAGSGYIASELCRGPADAEIQQERSAAILADVVGRDISLNQV